MNAVEGFWSFMRSLLCPQRGSLHEKLPWFLEFFESLRNIRKRGKSLLFSLVASLCKTSKHKMSLIQKVLRIQAKDEDVRHGSFS